MCGLVLLEGANHLEHLESETDTFFSLFIRIDVVVVVVVVVGVVVVVVVVVVCVMVILTLFFSLHVRFVLFVYFITFIIASTTVSYTGVFLMSKLQDVFIGFLILILAQHTRS